MAPLRKALQDARTALGDGRRRREKLRDAARTARGLLDAREQRRRLEQLRAEGLIEELPGRWQVAVASWRMFFDFIIPGSRRYYKQTGKNFLWQQVLRILDEPCAMMDPVGLGAPEDAIISHLVQVGHHAAAYDVELLRMFPNGVEHLRDEVRLLVEGRHPRQAAIDAICEVADYHERLLEALDRYLEDPEAHGRVDVLGPPPGTEAMFEVADERYLTPSRFFKYCLRMPP
ncbi:MAG: hypothetical protein K8I02_02950, partial [Candidatus Methylomirabilis sp.]|nr:hypothetical protein [Deltaproteobacteria bacterium]